MAGSHHGADRRRQAAAAFFFSTPSDVAARIVKWFVDGTIWKHLWITLVESVLAFVIGSVAGVLIGFWFAQQPRVAAVFDPYVKMINALPRVVLAPIFALWLGLGIWSKVALGVTLVFFIVFFNVYQGVKEVSPTVLANARMLGMGERALMRHVYWPSALSWMFSSLHTAVGFAVVGAVVGEYLGSAAGLGYLIQQAEGVFDVAGVFAGMSSSPPSCLSSIIWSRSSSAGCWSGGRLRLKHAPEVCLPPGGALLVAPPPLYKKADNNNRSPLGRTA